MTGLETVWISNRAVACVCVSLLLPFSQSELVATLVKSLRAVADSSKPSQLETALSETLLISLSHLMEIEESSEELLTSSTFSSSFPLSFFLSLPFSLSPSISDVQLDVLLLWHTVVDHHGNKPKLPLNT